MVRAISSAERKRLRGSGCDLFSGAEWGGEIFFGGAEELESLSDFYDGVDRSLVHRRLEWWSTLRGQARGFFSGGREWDFHLP